MGKAVSVAFILLTASLALAQPRGGLPPISPIPPVGISSPGFRGGGFARSRHRGGSFGYPFLWGDYDSPYYDYPPNYDYPPAPSVVIVQPPPPYMMLPEVPAEPARSEIHEYAPATSTAASTPGNESPVFGIVLKDGSTRSAIAVAAQNQALYYVEPNGRHQRIGLDEIDRDATLKLNRERHLELQLPAPDR